MSLLAPDAAAGPLPGRAGAALAAPLASIDPRARLAAAAGFALVAVSLTRLPLLGAAEALAVAAAVAARLPARPTLRRLAALDGFVLAALAFLPFTVPGAAVARVAGWPVSAAGLAEAARILLTCNAVVLMLLALAGGLEPTAIGRALGGLGVPERLVQLLLFTVRAIELIGREYRSLRLAMRARAFRMRTTPHTWRSLGYLFGMLLVRSLDRSERMLAAMRCRGFTGRFPQLHEPRPLTRRDAAFAALASLACAALLAAEWA